MTIPQPSEVQGKSIDVQARLEYAGAAVAVLRSLRIAESTMRYGQFATAIGLKSESEPWQPWHRQQVRDILNLVAATEHQAGNKAGTNPLEFERVVREDGQPGTGFSKVSRIVTSQPDLVNRATARAPV
jgi:hypothetical protein